MGMKYPNTITTEPGFGKENVQYGPSDSDEDEF